MAKTNFNQYVYTCKGCGKQSVIKSNQPAGCYEPFICECYKTALLQVPEHIKGKYLYKTRIETLRLQNDIVDTIEDIEAEMTLRQIYYRLVAAGYPKEDEFYKRVKRTLLDMRERGTLPYGLIADNSRSFYKPRTYSSLEGMLKAQQSFYRKDFWEGQRIHLEIWLEKEALRNVFWDVTDHYQVPLYVTKGLSSVSFVYAASEEIKRIDKPTVIYFFSDYDPSGLVLTRAIERRMREFDVVDAEFIRGGLTRDQIDEYQIETRKTKPSKHSAGFVGDSAELDALHPAILKQILTDCIEDNIDMEAFDKLKGVEEAEKKTLATITNNLRHAI